MFIGIYNRSQVSVYRTIGPLVFEALAETQLCFMPPNSEEVEGAYWFVSVRPVVCRQSVMRE